MSVVVAQPPKLEPCSISCAQAQLQSMRLQQRLNDLMEQHDGGLHDKGVRAKDGSNIY
jgi:hypothetical protein